MIRLDDREPTPARLRGAILALGNFDGFHLGHQAVVGEAIAWARSEGRAAIVATFDPHPIELFRPDAPPFRLTTLEQRAELFAAAGADAMLVFGFDRAMAAMSPPEWLERVLAGTIGARGVVTGGDFTFGRARAGDTAQLARLGARHGIAARTAPPVLDNGEPVSSTRVRAALAAADCATATRLLTRPFAVRGAVEHGDKRGRTLGYPTANLSLGDYVRPRFGVYAVTATLADGRVLRGAANLGVRPMIVPPKELLEPHFFDFADDLYGQVIEVRLRHYLRAEARFAGLEALSAQLARDCETAAKLLSAGAP